MEGDKILLVFDSNNARDTFKGEVRYDRFSFSADFLEISHFVKENNLSEFIHIAIPEFVFEELLQQKQDTFKDDLGIVTSSFERLKTLEEVKIENLEIPDKDLDIKSKLRPLAEAFLKENDIILIKFKEEDKTIIFNKIIDRAINKKNPFKGGKNNNSDAGFKDTLIWEAILNYELIKNYNLIYFISNDGGFKNCQKELNSDTITCEIRKSLSVIRTELETRYNSLIVLTSVEKHIQTDIFLINLKEELCDELNMDEENITNIVLTKVEDFVDYKDGGLLPHPELFDIQDNQIIYAKDLQTQYILFYDVTTTERIYSVKILFDKSSNERISIYSEPKGDENE